jgi:transmembrane sensor
VDKHYFIELLHKYLKGEATKEELDFLASYYNLFRNEPDVLNLLTGEEKAILKGQMHRAIWHNISRGQQPVGRLRKMNLWKMGLTAAAAILIVFSVRLFFTGDRAVRKKSIADLTSLINENHVITLPDGSMVMLDSGSKLNYPSSFDGLSNREVYLDGQAFFDVKHNPSSPFIVHAGKLNVTVLGTSFNIKAFPVDADITVTVKGGMVRVSDLNKTFGTIIPHQQMIYNKGEGNAIQQIVNTDDYMSWKEQDQLFDNLTVCEAAALLEARFNVKILIKDKSIGGERFTATFPRNESLEDALKSICEFNGAVYQYDKGKATVFISNK